jgi:predicted  nucleic acid-binding Zn-ribbon protein
MTNEDKIFEFLTRLYAEMQKGFKEVNGRIDKLEDEVKEVKKTVLKIEQDHGQKLEALFDGYKQNYEKLCRIEEEVSKHEEFILRRIR